MAEGVEEGRADLGPWPSTFELPDVPRLLLGVKLAVEA